SWTGTIVHRRRRFRRSCGYDMGAFLKRRREQAKKRAIRRKLERELNRVWDVFTADLEKATTWEERGYIQQQRDFECSEFQDQIDRMDSLDLERRAQRLHIAVSDFPAPPDAPHHWIQGPHG